MIKSCLQCQNKCCRTGPGPHITISVEEYLENFGSTNLYNKQCEHLTSYGKCALWGTPLLPEECRTYVCQNREFSKKELRIIDEIEDHECPNCQCQWMRQTKIGNKRWILSCEACGCEVECRDKILKRGRRSMKRS